MKPSNPKLVHTCIAKCGYWAVLWIISIAMSSASPIDDQKAPAVGAREDAAVVIATLKASAVADAAIKDQALLKAEMIRKDAKVPTPLRYEAAYQAEYAKINSTKASSSKGERIQSEFGVADKLRAEFGNCTETDRHYVSLLNKALPAVAAQKAQELLKSSALSAYLKREAKLTVTRQSWIGKPILPELQTTRGDKLVTKDPESRFTVLIFTSSNEVFRTAATDKKVRWVHVALKNPDSTGQAQKDAAVNTWPTLYEPAGYNSPLCRRLHAEPGRTVYVFDRTGALVGFGAKTDLAKLVAVALK